MKKHDSEVEVNFGLIFDSNTKTYISIVKRLLQTYRQKLPRKGPLSFTFKKVVYTEKSLLISKVVNAHNCFAKVREK